jgi:hypothetical protein
MTETPIFDTINQVMKDSNEAGRLLGIAQEQMRILKILDADKKLTPALLNKIGDTSWQQDSAGPLTKRKLRNAKNESAKA